MSEIDRMKDQLQRAWLTDAWHGPSVLENLEGVDAARAAARPLKNVHSIWEITLHMAAWKDVVRHALLGTRKMPTDEENFPTVTDTSPAKWAEAQATLAKSHEALMAAVSAYPDDRLDQPPISDGKRTAYVLIHGAVQHDLYHAGQIAILKKG
jgi:uncharacterized damage-inducible protein DinB